MIYLSDINDSNWRYPLSVANEQKRYVADSAVLLARAYAYRNHRSRAFLISNEGTPVGMGLYYDCPEQQCYIFSEFFIDHRYQNMGYGKAAAGMVLEELRHDGSYGKVILCYIEGNEAAKKLYESLGFQEIDRDEDEIIMELEL